MAKQVRVYYLGGLAEDGKSHPIEAGGRMLFLPKIGGFFDLPEWRARILIDKYRLEGRDGEKYEIFTTDRALASMVAKTGMLPPAGKSLPIEAMSDEVLIEALNKRGYQLGQKDQEPVEPVELVTETIDKTIDEVGEQDEWNPPSPLSNPEPEPEAEEEIVASSKSKKGK